MTASWEPRLGQEDVAVILRRLRQTTRLYPVWSWHAERERLPQYARQFGIDRLGCERIVRTGIIGTPEVDLRGRETVHVGGAIDGRHVDVVVAARPEAGSHLIVIVTLKPKP